MSHSDKIEWCKLILTQVSSEKWWDGSFVILAQLINQLEGFSWASSQQLNALACMSFGYIVFHQLDFHEKRSCCCVVKLEMSQ